MNKESAKPSVWHAQTADAAMQTLDATPSGLSATAVSERLLVHGPNLLPPPLRRSAWLRFFAQFNNVLVLVLLGAGVVTLLLGHYVDAGVIVGVTILNALIGFIQEGKAEAALEAIRSMLTPTAAVLRDGQRQSVDAADLVPGDIVLLAEGDRVPADLRLLEAKNLRIEESALTGEAMPVEKSLQPVSAESVPGDRLCMAFSGTLVVYGAGRGLVVETGSRTEIGQISAMLASVEEIDTPMLRKMAQFSRVLTVAIAILAAVAFVCGVWLGHYSWGEMFMVAVGIAVAAIPEGLPAIVTITLAIGVQRMARRNAIVRRLPAVETLGSVTVICTDKTGTLTRNEMTVQRVATSEHLFEVGGVGYGPEGGIHLDGQRIEPREYAVLGELARAGLLCNDAQVHADGAQWRLQGDPTEGSLCALAMKAGLQQAAEDARAPRRDVIPFAAENRFMATLHDTAIYLKGAPEAVLARCRLQRTLAGDVPLDLPRWEAQNDKLASQGLRVLALASAMPDAAQAELPLETLGNDFVLLGLVGIIDPPREEAQRSVALCRDAGIRVKMITGDHAITARAIGQQLGLGEPEFRSLTGAQIEAMNDEELRDAAQQTDIFARASPAHKLRLVEALQARGEVVAMTGDGVNDAPALKRASVGVAMGQKGTEVAKEAAEMVLADDNFASISHAVEEGRTVYENIRKAILYILPTNGGEAGAILVAMLLGMQMPITPVQILWVNMVTEVTLSLSLAFLPVVAGSMQRPPRDPAEPLLTGFLGWRILIVTSLMTAAALILFRWELAAGASLASARTVAVNMVVVGEVAYLLNCRDLERSVLSLEGIFGNRPAWISIAIVMSLQLAFTYVPWLQTWFGTGDVSLASWGRIALGGLLILLVVESEKVLVARWRR
ncbi:cation-transporting P-type ATPase [Uliginosibacterium sp. 31-16]|uniref:cation-transporting P-type ATPase n=1 Tax=Uliginosibacterium sp. 31-16 TaxID=3068315 RepID=UPI00273DB909|nr:cation-transporting P-type ATPase [Uliginosibacterium sp. 31-16]MDP5239858.1 cation-transporting P-type ATPase [Uliginosibacterium sp. 31-16]